MSTCVKTYKTYKIHIKHIKSTSRKFNVQQLEDKIIAKEMETRIGGAFEPLLNLETSVVDLYELFEEKTNAITKIFGHNRQRILEGMS